MKLNDIPTTGLTFIFAWIVIFGTMIHYFATKSFDTGWGVFLISLIVGERGGMIGKRWTTKPELVITETEEGPPTKTTTTEVMTPPPAESEK